MESFTINEVLLPPRPFTVADFGLFPRDSVPEVKSGVHSGYGSPAMTPVQGIPGISLCPLPTKLRIFDKHIPIKVPRSIPGPKGTS